jgi:hypothetical protein
MADAIDPIDDLEADIDRNMRASLLCSPSRVRNALERPSGEIAVGGNRPELRRAGSGARDDGRSDS